jgi:hypothetical protein
MKASCENIFYEFGNKHWRKLDSDCGGEVRQYLVKPDEGELQAIRDVYGAKRTSGLYRSFCEAHLTSLRSVHPDWEITPRRSTK